MHANECALAFSVKDSCLCCCGPYIPNIEKGTCEDLRELIPRIDDVAEALQKALGNPEEQQQGMNRMGLNKDQLYYRGLRF